MVAVPTHYIFFFFNDTATTEIYTLSLHDALPISGHYGERRRDPAARRSVPPRARPASRDRYEPVPRRAARESRRVRGLRSEEHTSELQSLRHLVCRLLLEKKKKQRTHRQHPSAHQ